MSRCSHDGRVASPAALSAMHPSSDRWAATHARRAARPVCALSERNLWSALPCVRTRVEDRGHLHAGGAGPDDDHGWSHRGQAPCMALIHRQPGARRPRSRRSRIGAAPRCQVQAPSRRCSKPTSMTEGIPPQPLTAPAVMPETICRWKNRNMTRGGIVIRTTSANSRLNDVLNWLMKLKSVSCAVTFCDPGRK